MKKQKPLLTLAAVIGLVVQSQAQVDRERPDWGPIKKRIESAVERGDLTRDQATQKYLEIKKKMGVQGLKPQTDQPVPKRPVRPRSMARKDQPSDTLGKVLGALVQQGKIDRADVARIRRAAMTVRPPARPPHMPPPHDRRPPVHSEQPGDDMRELLEAAKRELTKIREIRRHLQQAHQRHELETAKRRLMEERRELEERHGHPEHRREMREREANEKERGPRQVPKAKRRNVERERPARETEKKREETRDRKER